MGRPIKTAKLNGSIGVDSGYNNPTGPTNTYGVVAGNTALTPPSILCRVKIGTDAEANGYIIRQRGTRKYLVADGTAVADENIVAGNSYVITVLGTTNWTALGASSNPSVGDIFTAKISGTGLTTTGQVNRVGVCILANLANGALTANTMTVTATKADASTVRLAKFGTSYGIDFSNNGYTLTFNAAGPAPAGTLYPLAQVASA